MTRMNVRKDINLGTVFAILLFLLGQTAAGSWWASSITESLDRIVYVQNDQETRIRDMERQITEALMRQQIDRGL